MTERPILFSGPMVRALLDRRKTQTRRIVKIEVPADADEVFFWSGEDLRRQGHRNVAETGVWARKNGRDGYLRFLGKCPYGVPGDTLWVREGHLVYDTHGQRREDGQRWGPWAGLPTRFNGDRTKIAYFREGFDRCDPGRWRSSIHMPRWAARLTLDITDVRVQRLHDISQADAEAEGIIEYEPTEEDPAGFAHTEGGEIWNNAVSAYDALWRKINGPESWEANPWVWAVTFEVRERP